jgi:hypothetical protein
MKRVGLISKYSPKVSNVYAIATWALSQAAVDECLYKKASPISCFRLYAGAHRARNNDVERNSFHRGRCNGTHTHETAPEER